MSITSDGHVSWPAPAVLHSSCSLDMTYFPWDTQNCPLTFGSWILDSSQMDLHNVSPTGDLSGFIINGELTMESFNVHKEMHYFTNSTPPHPVLRYEIVVTRRAKYYVTNLILPCVFISGTVLLVFLLPPESGEKVSLALTILLATTVFLTMVAKVMPAQSTVIPLICRYLSHL